MSNAGQLNYPINIMIPLLELMFQKDMDIRLARLKQVIESK
jgi:hypothetical protein